MDGDGRLARDQGEFFRPVARAGLSSSAGVRYERGMRAWKRSASSVSARSDCRFPKI
jgi:hypothetical protein